MVGLFNFCCTWLFQFYIACRFLYDENFMFLIAVFAGSYETARQHEKLAKNGILIGDSTDIEAQGRSMRRKEKKKLPGEENDPASKQPNKRSKSTPSISVDSE